MAVAGLVDEAAAQSISRWAALAVAKLNQTALPGEHLDGQFPAVFASHRALDAFDDGGDRAAIILELLGAVLDADAGASCRCIRNRRFRRRPETCPSG